MNNIFIDKYNKRVVHVNGICTFEEISDEISTFYGSDRLRTETTCIYCTEENTNKLFAIPLITFLNTYTPYSKKVDDLLINLNKLANDESESVDAGITPKSDEEK